MLQDSVSNPCTLAESANSTISIKYRCPFTVVRNYSKQELWTGEKVVHVEKYLVVLLTLIYVAEKCQKKFNPKAKKKIFVEFYEITEGYSFTQ